MKHAAILVLTVLLAISLQGCPGGKAAAKVDKKDDTPALPVEIATIRQGDVSATYSGTTTLEAAREANVVARVQGVVEKIYVEEGARLKAGQVLASLDDDKLRLELKQQTANLEQKQQTFRRNTELYEKKLISADVWDRSKFEFAEQQAVTNLAKLNVNYATIRTPISGVVVKRLIKVGNMVTANQPVFTVTDFSSLEANLYVPERELSRLKPGQKTNMHVDALPGTQFQGAVERISPQVDPASGTFKVTVRLNDPKHELAPGMFGRVNIIYDTHHDTLLAPRNAVSTEDGENIVFVVNNSVAHRRAVQTGYEDTDLIEVTNGLKAGDKVVTLGQNSLKDGAKVTVINTSSTQKSTRQLADASN